MVEWGDLPAWGSLVLAGAALAISIYSSAQSEKSAKAIRSAERRWQSEIDQHGQIHEWQRGAKEWGGRVLVVVSELQSISTGHERKASLLAELSALIDEGRWTFPNSDFDTFGVEKEFAYAGIRERLLDDLVFIHDIARDGALYGRPMGSKDVWDLRRDFVSELQAKINPDRTRFEEIKARRAVAGGESPVIEFAKSRNSGDL